MSQTTFDRLGLPADLVAALAAQHITEPFAIQDLTLPDALDGRDILGRAPTGSGKTLAFGLPALARLAGTEKAIKRRPRGLILSPTRELADQIQRELAPLATVVRRRVDAVYGGASMGKQITALRKGIDLLVACPGRLLDLIEQGEVSLADVEIAVVDEADRMADMGFLPDVRRILDQTMEDRQTLLFSATLDGDVKTLTDRYQNDPALHEIGDPEPDLSTVEHRFIKLRKPDRMDVAADLIDGTGSTVVFVRTRHGVDRLARQLKQRGVKAGYIHGGRTQSQRSRALELFTAGKVDALVATDVAARGIHVDGVACVLHYDPPADIKDYVHRSGRTARAGAGGVVVSFLDPAQVKESQKMQRQLGIETEIEAPPEPSDRDRTAVVVDDSANGARRGAGGRSKTAGKPRSGGRTAGKGKSNGRGRAKAGATTDDRSAGTTSRSGAKPKAKAGTSTRTSTSSGASSTRASSNGASSTRASSNGASSTRASSNGASSTRGSSSGASKRAKSGTSATTRTRRSARAEGADTNEGSSRARSGGKPRTAGPKGRTAAKPGGKRTKRSAADSRSGESGRRSGDGDGRSGTGSDDRSGAPRPRKAKAAGPGKARAKRTPAKATKRSGRSRPPNRKGKLKGRRSTSSGG